MKSFATLLTLSALVLPAALASGPGHTVDLRPRITHIPKQQRRENVARAKTTKAAAKAKVTGIGASFVSSATVDAGAANSILAAAKATGAGNLAAGAAAATTTTDTASAKETSVSESGSKASGSDVDLTVLQFALVLEQLETEFYNQVLKKFTLQEMLKQGVSLSQATIILQELQTFQGDESTHVQVLTNVIESLGAKPLNKCKFNVDAVLKDVPTVLAIARTVEAVGVSAYLGAASLVSDKTLLTAAASILTIEARHQSLLNTFNVGGFAAQAFDIPLATQDILSLVGGFLEGCTAEDLGLTTLQPLSITDKRSKSTTFNIGSQLEFDSTVDISDSSKVFCQMFVGGAAEAMVFPLDECVVPAKINGIVAVTLTKTNKPLSSDVTKQDQKDRLTGTGIIFVDSVEENLGALFAINEGSRGGGGGKKDNFGNGNRHRSPSADLGKYYANHLRGNRGGDQSIVIISKTEVIKESSVVIIKESNNGGDRGNRHEGNGGRGGQESNNRHEPPKGGSGHEIGKPSRPEESRPSPPHERRSAVVGSRRMQRLRRGSSVADVVERGWKQVDMI